MNKIITYLLSIALITVFTFVIYDQFISKDHSDQDEVKNAIPVESSIENDKKNNQSNVSLNEDIDDEATNNEAQVTDSTIQDYGHSSEINETNQLDPVTEVIIENEVHEEAKMENGQISEIQESTQPQIDGFKSEPILIALISSLVVSIVIIFILSIAVSKLYTWRKRIEENSKLLVMPEVYYEKLNDLSQGIQSIGGIISDFSKHLTVSERNTEKKFDEFLQLVAKAQSSLDAKDEELKRFKQGYDFQLKKDSINTILKLRERVEFYVQDQASSEDLSKACEGMLRIIDHELDANGVVSIHINPGISIRDIDDLEVAETVVTSDQQKVGQVIETIRNGYVFEGQGIEKTIIKKPFLKIYVEE